MIVVSIDNPPTEIPYESPISSSYNLEPFVPNIAKSEFSDNINKCKLTTLSKRAVIFYKYEFTPDIK